MKAQLPLPPPKRSEQRLNLHLRVPASLIDRLEVYRLKQPVPPTLTATVVYLLDKGMGTKP